MQLRNLIFNTCFFSFVLTLLSAVTLQAQIGLSPSPEYQGFRIFVSQMSLEKVKPDYTLVEVTLINTGREVFKLQPAMSDKMVLKFDKSFQKILAQVDSTDFTNALFNSGITLSPGQIEKGFGIKVIPTPQRLIIPPTPVVAEALPEQEVEKVKPAKKSKREKSEINTPELADNNKVDQPDTTVDLPETSEKEIITSEKKAVVHPKAILEEEPAPSKISTSEGCADLVLEELKILKQTKNNVVLGYTLRNVGIGAVNINGSTSEEGLALRGHLSSSDQLSRGALTIGGKFVNANSDDANIEPGSSYQGSVKLPLHKLTKFTPYLILQVDPYQMIMECDETNNLQFINLIPDSPMSKTTDQ